jgi:hypothetical protein
MAKKQSAIALLCLVIILIAVSVRAEDEAELAKKLQNPIAALISVPLQSNWDFGIGHENAMRYTLNVQPVIPISISNDWNVIIPVSEVRVSRDEL